jgi:tetratricopeptide (TPR) repeat protein
MRIYKGLSEEMTMRSCRRAGELMISSVNSKMRSQRTPATGRAARLTEHTLREHWAQLHRGDREPFPDLERIDTLAASARTLSELVERLGGAAAVAKGLQRAWAAFHNGQFADAIKLGGAQGAFGAAAANKAAAVHSLYAQLEPNPLAALLIEAGERGEAAVRLLPHEANVHYSLALVLGRYSQRLSILRALAQGMAERVRSHLERTLELEPQHAEAHVALGLFHAEIVAKLGSIAASLTYRTSASAAIKHFERAVELTPHSPIALMEYAHGLRLLDAGAHRREVLDLYQRAAACRPLDTVDQLDCKRAREELAAL